MELLKAIGTWIVLSSKNPEKVSLFFKGVIGFLIMLGVSDATNLEQLSNSLLQVIITSGQAITALITLYGAGRKIYLTFISNK